MPIFIFSLLFLAIICWLSIRVNRQNLKLNWPTVIGSIAALSSLLILLGKAHWVTALVGAALPFMKWMLSQTFKLIPLLARIPFLRQWLTQKAFQQANKSRKNKPAPEVSSTMDKAQACKILGVQENASAKEIKIAHKKLMQKCHPDRGGNDYLASQLNEAKKFLLG